MVSFWGMNKWILIIGILALVALGFLFFSTMTGNVITGGAVSSMSVENEYFRIDDFGSELNGGSDDGESGSG